MQMFSTPNNSRKDIPCGYPKTFRRIYTGHTVREVFHTEDTYDRFIAIGDGVSYSTNFTNGYWKRAKISGEFSSGCHLSSNNTEINIIICDSGEYYVSKNGVDWSKEGRISSEKYSRGWSCICAGPNCVIAVNNTFSRTTVDEQGTETVISNGLGAYGVYDTENDKIRWADISLPFSSNKVRYFNEHFYIYGAVIKNEVSINDAEFTKTTQGNTTITKFQDITVPAGDQNFSVTNRGAEIVSAKVKAIDIYGIESTLPDAAYLVNVFGSSVTITLTDPVATESAFRVYYEVKAENCMFNFSVALAEDLELKDVLVIATYSFENEKGEIETATETIKTSFEEKTGEAGYSCYATIEAYSNAKFSLSCRCLNASIVSAANYMAFSDNGANFEFVSDPLTESGDVANEAAYGRGIYVAVTENGRAIYSTYTPGRNWNFIDELEELGYSWKGVAFVSGMFVVSGADAEGNTVLYCSIDTKSWMQIPFIATTSEDINSKTITRLLSLTDCRGSLVATALSPFSTDSNLYTYDNERGFFVCDTYVPIKESELVVTNEEVDNVSQDILLRAIAVENTIKSFNSRISELEKNMVNEDIKKYVDEAIKEALNISADGIAHIDAGRINN